ncbi:hypothetical protein L249_0541 [Ophiocordyceps polyrhachis-furcata BCC 54312]|uniref:Uncharacterized protein n=1 Tax=Ophiocordyceps polyrhachis-furcata BCC 54312 TaxID=1330021 RepID=A0A367LEH1_9HYPO|nr:hypothetical protein L249_0541 [Ophiocordyceps polyrhachis-furcata BCC 54312]
MALTPFEAPTTSLQSVDLARWVLIAKVHVHCEPSLVQMRCMCSMVQLGSGTIIDFAAGAAMAVDAARMEAIKVLVTRIDLQSAGVWAIPEQLIDIECLNRHMASIHSLKPRPDTTQQPTLTSSANFSDATLPDGLRQPAFVLTAAVGPAGGPCRERGSDWLTGRYNSQDTQKTKKPSDNTNYYVEWLVTSSPAAQHLERNRAASTLLGIGHEHMSSTLRPSL